MSDIIDKSGLRTVAVGFATHNLKHDSLYLFVHILELISTEDVTYKLDSKPKQSGIGKLFGGLTKGAVIKCRYYGDGSNRISPPSVYKGETIEVLQFADTDQFFWRPFAPYETELRGYEASVEVYSNLDKSKKKNHLKKVDKKSSYYRVIDTEGKKIHTHTSRNDNEPAEWDDKLDTKKGVRVISNSKGTYIKLELEKITLHAKTVVIDADHIIIKGHKDISVKTPKGIYDISKMTIKGGTVYGKSIWKQSASTTFSASVSHNASTTFNGHVSCNGNAKTSDGSSVL